MNLQKLGKQLQRDAKAHPAKAGVLALVAVVAIWFWAPLITGWLSDAKPAPVVPAVAGSPSGPAAPAPAAVTSASSHVLEPKSDVPQPDWRELVGRMKKDELMLPAPSTRKGRDPFAALAQKNGKTVEDKPAEKFKPESLGLILSGTLIGSRQSVATINGRSYVLGSQGAAVAQSPPTNVEVTVEQQGKRYHLNLVSITANSVLLEYQGQRFPLEIQEKALDSKNSIEINQAAARP